ncbi:hypothetical protein VTL71DRAFT_3870 [Oculimacula yallundae]|uniref:Uncharacterized protein n=1 Tax=Oculimacula yallundae TaxID=86028 RepID=A0ABR4C475_9HELO
MKSFKRPRPHSFLDRTSRLFTRDIAAHLEKLAQYQQNNGPERAGANRSASRPIDTNYIEARLEEDPESEECCCETRESTPFVDPEETYGKGLEKESKDFNLLTKDGGRPSHPLNLTYDVAKDADAYREILRYWNGIDPNGWMVFGKQLQKWKRFRTVQRRMRTEGPLKDEGFFDHPPQPGRFAGYIHAIRDRLSKHGFDRPFQLNEDLDQQDTLSTWIEYIYSVCLALDNYADTIERQQRSYDEAWKNLLGSKVMSPSETKELMWTLDFGLQISLEVREATRDVELATKSFQSAESAFKYAPQLGSRYGRDPSQRIAYTKQQLCAAKNKLVTASNALKFVTRRCKLIADFHIRTREYTCAKSDAKHENILLHWTLQQISSIELESNQAKLGSTDSKQRNHSQQPLKRDRQDDGDEKPLSKRRKQDEEFHLLSVSKLSATTTQEISFEQEHRRARSSTVRLSDPNMPEPGLVLDSSASQREKSPTSQA